MRKLTLAEREILKTKPVNEIPEDSGYIIENGKVVGVADEK